jgi:putative drug exporter of the RND superfamily
VAGVAPAHLNPAGTSAVVAIFPKTSKQDHRTQQLIDHLREEVLPAATAGTGLRTHIRSQTAPSDDSSADVTCRAWFWFVSSARSSCP